MDKVKRVVGTVALILAALVLVYLITPEAVPEPVPEPEPRVRPEPPLSCIFPDEKLLVIWIDGERLHFRESEIRPEDR